MERKKWEFPPEFLPKIKEKCDEFNLKLGITPFYINAVEECSQYLDFFKIASYELLWSDLIRKCCETNKKLIISTGMANMTEIKDAVLKIEHTGRKDLSIFTLCVLLPVSDDEVNLKAIKSMSEIFSMAYWMV